ncbi:MAG: FAD:protein FMN transferase [bacterium]
MWVWIIGCKKNYLRSLIILLFIFILSCSKKTLSLYHRSQFLMGTVVEIKIVCDDETIAGEAIDQAFTKMREIERIMSAKDPKSMVSRINNESALHEIVIPPSLVEVIDTCLSYSADTEGAFDISIGSITKLWDFHQETPILPSEESVRLARKRVNYKWIELDKEKSSLSLKREGMSLDLGAVAKGYSIDQAACVLKRFGISAGIINAGGDLMLFGQKPGNGPWNIGIQHPRKKNSLIENLRITDKAIVTSGDYERYFIINNKRYHHILDPGTGWPAWGCQSVSIIAPSAMIADIIATAVFVLGPEKGMKYIERSSLIEGMIIDSAGKKYYSTGWKQDAAFQNLRE